MSTLVPNNCCAATVCCTSAEYNPKEPTVPTNNKVAVVERSILGAKVPGCETGTANVAVSVFGGDIVRS